MIYVKIVEIESSSWISRFINKVSNKYFSYLNLKVIPLRDNGYGDYLKFLEFDYDSVTIFAYEEDNLRHTSDDTIERLNIPYLTRGAKLLLATIAEFACFNEYEF